MPSREQTMWAADRVVMIAFALIVLVAALVVTHYPVVITKESVIEVRESTVVQPISVADQVAQVRDAVVHVYKKGECQGSGCLISPDGIMFTAKHVSDNQPGDYEITLDDGRKFPVKYVIEDKENDVTFMQLDLGKVEPNLPYAKLASEDGLRPGDGVFIMGSPLGFENFNSVSLGILSANNRDLTNQAGGEAERYTWHVMLQTTSPAYPGNSGGPVFDMQGNVIGVLVAGMDATLNWAVPVARFSDTIDTVRDWFRLCRFNVVESKAPTVELNFYMDSLYQCH